MPRLAVSLTLAAVLAVMALAAPWPTAAQQVPESAAEIRLSFAPVVRQTAPSVVTIYTRKVVEQRRSPFAGDPFFEQFFGGLFGARQTRDQVLNSLGSGVVLDPGGIVVSNHHVIAGADEITVVLSDKREFDGRVIFADEDSDLAVVQLDGAADLPALALRDSDTIEVGDLVLAIGNPFGVGQTVTSGIVSGLARADPRRQRARGRPERGGYFIQTDAAINPGNSGGALVDMAGRLVGVPTSILSRSGGSNGIGFAVPANLVARVIEAARAGESELARPWLGVAAQPVDGDMADALGLDRPRGVLLDMLHPESPLAAAGLEPGDVITEVEGRQVESPAGLAFRTATLGTDRTVRLSFLRQGRARNAAVRLGPAPERPARDPRRLRSRMLGTIEVETVNPAVLAETGLPLSARGVLVREIDRLARERGLRPGDVIGAVDGQKVETSRALADALDAVTGGMVIELLRDGRRGTITIRG